MTAKELRIGNWVDWNGENGVVSQILEHEVVFKCGEDTLISELKPIELTEEILLKCGFSKDNELYFRFYLLDKSIQYDLDDNCICISDSWEWNKIKYLHQLQNLYWCLCNEELNVNM